MSGDMREVRDSRPLVRRLSDVPSRVQAEIARRRCTESASDLAREFGTTVSIVKKIYQRHYFL